MFGFSLTLSVSRSGALPIARHVTSACAPASPNELPARSRLVSELEDFIAAQSFFSFLSVTLHPRRDTQSSFESFVRKRSIAALNLDSDAALAALPAAGSSAPAPLVVAAVAEGDPAPCAGSAPPSAVAPPPPPPPERRFFPPRDRLFFAFPLPSPPPAASSSVDAEPALSSSAAGDTTTTSSSDSPCPWSGMARSQLTLGRIEPREGDVVARLAPACGVRRARELRELRALLRGACCPARRPP
mmetsp:Transcript_473/g.1630  ORF Transcript_473/g.1630 Transcript_473/m.1630 type:complete len:244 (-) Transcript_473:78-809(-)